jgi:tetratricopeptide (TPR) repeat protein
MYAVSLIALGASHTDLGHLLEAESSLQLALRIKPNEYLSALANRALGDLHVRAGRPKRAVAHYQRAIAGLGARGNPSLQAAARLGLGRALIKLGRRAEGRALIEAALPAVTHPLMARDVALAQKELAQLGRSRASSERADPG